MVIQYTVCDIDLPQSIKFPYLVNVQVLPHNLILENIFPVKFPYPVKASIRKSIYIFESNNNQLHK